MPMQISILNTTLKNLIPEFNKMFSFSFFCLMKTLFVIEKHYIAVRKKHLFSNYFTILPINPKMAGGGGSI